MTTVRSIMTPSPQVVSPTDSIQYVATLLRDGDIGGVIVCNEDRHLEGMVTDRDIATRVVADGLDPRTTTAGELLDDAPMITIGADDDVKQAVSTMKEHAVRRLPVVDGQDLVGIVSQADLARHAPESLVGEMVDEISAAPDNTGRG
ncbi:MAG TPA: CBS domain-containing protein [Acidimicrobiia bacterium]|nr:CBS domain-containing protein [Acidimicrobiia bacterium]